MTLKQYILFFVFTLIFAVMQYGVTTYESEIAHESVHKQVALYNGCTNYTMEINMFSGSWFRCDNRSAYYTGEYDREEYIIDSMNEVVTYNLKSISSQIIILNTLLFSILLLLLVKK